MTVTRVELGDRPAQRPHLRRRAGQRGDAGEDASAASAGRRLHAARSLGQKLRLRHTPELAFEYDEGLDAHRPRSRGCWTRSPPTKRRAAAATPAAPRATDARGRLARGTAACARRDGRGQAGRPTSHDVVDRVRRALGIRRAGHTGTLDPSRPACCPSASARPRASPASSPRARRRIARPCASASPPTPTTSPASPVRRRAPSPPTRGRVAAAARRLVGEQLQVPPAFSAKRSGGERLYDLARRGVVVRAAAGPGHRPRHRGPGRAGRPRRDRRALRGGHVRPRAGPRPRRSAGHGRASHRAAARGQRILRREGGGEPGTTCRAAAAKR